MREGWGNNWRPLVRSKLVFVEDTEASTPLVRPSSLSFPDCEAIYRVDVGVLVRAAKSL